MKLKFNPDLNYQKQAISSIVDLFDGQLQNQENFSIILPSEDGMLPGMRFTDHGIGNRLDLSSEEILNNLQQVQLRNGIKQSESLPEDKFDFDIEMETGTGKTYVYLRSIYELNKQYGFTKFVVVVPSIAIKEGVYKSLQMTEEHFGQLYQNTICEYFIYDSSQLDQVRNFAVSDKIQIMIINIDAFRRSFYDPSRESRANIIHRPHDRMSGMKPIDLIKETHPFVIIDEPQTVDTTPKAKKAIDSLNPLVIFRFSATHREKHHLVYRLDAVDAYEMELVKQIEVAGFKTAHSHNQAFIRLISVDNSKTPITARIEIDAQGKDGIARRQLTVRSNDDLYEKSNGREVYEGYIINEIFTGKGNEYIDFTSRPDIIRLGESIGDVDDIVIKEQQIRKTIEEHLNKELLLNKRGVKVLSLFFLDKVANYRQYDKKGNRVKGPYAKLFEKHYHDLIRKPKYKPVLERWGDDDMVDRFHDGYFSIDKVVKRGDQEEYIFKETKTGRAQSDDDAYNLIMRDKEKLLAFDSDLRFIFSHSALNEGWDNPNVFQICTLNESKSEIKRRQEIGRGLRLCVNQDGERLHGFDINTLTVMANESYEEFAEGLQQEIEVETGVKFGVIEPHTFANLTFEKSDGDLEYLGSDASKTLFDHFLEMNYIDREGKVTEKLKQALKDKDLDLPDELEDHREKIEALLSKITGRLKIKNNRNKQSIELNKQVFLSPEFKDLWDRIKYKTTYSVQFDSDKLIQNCVDEINSHLIVESGKIIYTKGKVKVESSGVTAEESDMIATLAPSWSGPLPDIITFLQNQTNLTRRSIVRILTRSNKLDLFLKNPQTFMDGVSKIIRSQLRMMIVDGIKYSKIGDDEYYIQEQFENEELFGYFSNMMASNKSIYEYVVYDSDNEFTFADHFEKNDSVKVYTKMPDWFRIDTPLGSYNPDWAVLMEKDGDLRLYFVLETKGNTAIEALRPTENAKILCGEAHFKALGNDVQFKAVDDYFDLIASL